MKDIVIRKTDVLIIGAGVVGAAAAMFLSQYEIGCVVLDKASDVSEGTSKANSGILHAGYDCHPGTLKAKLNLEGLEMFRLLATQLEIPHRMNGSLVITLEQNGADSLDFLVKRGAKNNVPNLEVLSGDDARILEPNLSLNVTAALRAKNAGIVSPYEAVIAMCENAAQHGVEFFLETNVMGITRSDGYVIHTSRGDFSAKIVINCAGVKSGEINNMVSESKQSISSQKGEYFLVDNTQKDLVHHTIFQLPTHHGKGVLVAPTVDYNVLFGPTALLTEDSSDTSTTLSGQKDILAMANLALKDVPTHDIITAFSGVRAKHASKDFVINEPLPGFINAIGIDSPGLTAAPAIGKMLAEMALSRQEAKKKSNYNPHRPAIKRFKDIEDKERAIRSNPKYGRILCRCETISEAEIVDSIHRPVGAKNLDGIKRRTRAQMGRCQGGFCTIQIMEVLAQNLKLSDVSITKNGCCSEIAFDNP